MEVFISNWHLNSYTDDTWTDLVVGKCTLATLTFSNVDAAIVNIEIRLVDSLDTPLMTILPLTPVDPNTADIINVRSINVLAGQKIQVRATAVGAEFLASGVTY